MKWNLQQHLCYENQELKVAQPKIKSIEITVAFNTTEAAQRVLCSHIWRHVHTRFHEQMHASEQRHLLVCRRVGWWWSTLQFSGVPFRFSCSSQCCSAARGTSAATLERDRQHQVLREQNNTSTGVTLFKLLTPSTVLPKTRDGGEGLQGPSVPQSPRSFSVTQVP